MYSTRNAGKGSEKPHPSPVSKPHPHITYMLRQCTSIVYFSVVSFKLKPFFLSRLSNISTMIYNIILTVKNFDCFYVCLFICFDCFFFFPPFFCFPISHQVYLSSFPISQMSNFWLYPSYNISRHLWSNLSSSGTTVHVRYCHYFESVVVVCVR